MKTKIKSIYPLLIFSLLVVLQSKNIVAQNLHTTWYEDGTFLPTTGLCVAITNDKGTGEFMQFRNNAKIIKCKKNADLLWSKKYNDAFHLVETVVGDTTFQIRMNPWNLSMHDNGDFTLMFIRDSVTLVYSNGVFVKSYSSKGYFLSRYDSTGIQLWGKYFTSTGSLMPNNIKYNSNKNEYIISGSYSDSSNVKNFNSSFYAKVDNNGFQLETKKVLNSNNGTMLVQNVSQDNVIVCGGDSDNFYVSKIDSGNNALWSQKYFLGSNLSPIQLFEKQNLHLVLLMAVNVGSYKNMIVELDSSGNLLWSKTIDFDNLDVSTNSQIFDKGNSTTFLFQNRIPKSPGGPPFDTVAFYAYNIDNNGSVTKSSLYYKTIQGYPISNNMSSFCAYDDVYLGFENQTTWGVMIPHNRCNVFTVDSNFSSCFFNAQPVPYIDSVINLTRTPAPLLFQNIALNSYDQILLIDTLTLPYNTFCTTNTSLDQEEGTNSLSIYPIPSDGIINIDFEHISTVNISLFNSMGQLVKNIENLNGPAISINISTFDNGIYLIRMVIDGRIYTRRIILNK